MTQPHVARLQQAPLVIKRPRFPSKVSKELKHRLQTLEISNQQTKYSYACSRFGGSMYDLFSTRLAIATIVGFYASSGLLLSYWIGHREVQADFAESRQTALQKYSNTIK